ncbi:class I SAM-dependent RNA methyltransferase [Actinomyces faecalis]|uniref:class I SAM-dependent RNA methyltransferase n=1 Tax=Actinomyces faecalis TaxID=2722820 RepID=UPI001551A0EB|nr:class I SAM-dependent RNA methyltransferase [Actinomyces faecalis]
MTAAREEIILAVGAPAHGGHCVARPVGEPDGHVVFVRHALPGETVRAVMTQKTSRTWRAEAVEVLSASPDRVRPAWAEAGAQGVGGGELSHVALPAQRTWKRWVLADCLRRVGGQKVADAVAAVAGQVSGRAGVAVEAMPSEQEAEASADARVRDRAGTATRTRVSLETTTDGQLGMHGFRSAEVRAVRTLPLAVREIQELGLPQRRCWRDLARSGGRLSAVGPSGGEPVVVVDGQVYSARGKPIGRKRVEEVVDATGLGLGELRYCVHADGFWQVHRDAPSVLVERVVRGSLTGRLEGSPARPGAVRAEGLKVLELYSGAGLLTLPLASLGAQVRSLEGSEQAVRDARRNLHAFPGAHLFAGRVTPAAVAELGAGFGQAGDQAADVVVLDPPRKGAGRVVVEAVADLGPRRVVLVACDPAAAARDLGAFLARGYSLTSMSSLDMFPHTHHFETLAVLSRD